MTAVACQWDSRRALPEASGVDSFKSGLGAADTWLGKAGAEHANGRVTTTVLCRDVSNCAFFSVKLVPAGEPQASSQDVSALVLWLALDISHHGAGLGSALLREVLAECVSAAARFPFRYISLDVAEGSAEHVRKMYLNAGFSETVAGSRRLRMKVSKAKKIVEALREKGVLLVCDSAALGTPAA